MNPKVMLYLSAIFVAAGPGNPSLHLLSFVKKRGCLKSPEMSTCVTTGSGLYLFACVGTSIFMLLHLPGFLFVKFQGLHDSFSLQRNHMNINKDL